MQTRRLGRTEHESTVAILGGAAFWNATPSAAEAGLRLAIDRGVNHLDIAPTYGAAEDVVGPYIPGVRDRLFIGAKTGRKNRDGVRAQFEATLTKLGVDSVDLYQAHGVTDLADLGTRTDAFEAILAARDEGLTRFVGVTGHDLGAPRAHLEAIRRFDLDTVMFPVYPRVWADPQYRADAEELLAECAARDVGVMVIKAVAREPWGTMERSHGTWYRPWTDPAAIAAGVAFALATPGVHAFCTPGDLALLPLALDAAVAFDAAGGTDDLRVSLMEESLVQPLIFPIAANAR